MKDTFLHRLKFLFCSGKNNKAKYYARSYWRRFVEPAAFYRHRLDRVLKSISMRPDRDEIFARANYYCKLAPGDAPLPESAPVIQGMPITRQKVYFFDFHRFARWFPKDMRVMLCPGDIVNVQPLPSIVKSRPLCPGNEYNVLMKLDAVRHYIFVNDHASWSGKIPKAIFMGKINGKRERIEFMELYAGSGMVDCGCVDRHPLPGREHWAKPKLTIPEQLRYRFIVCLEGNDVASNLKWVMSSRSLAVMPRPTCETWFMEGRLIPNVHYVEIKPDFSDLPQKIQYYNEHPEEAERIIDNAHKYVDSFRDPEREKLISLLTLSRYFAATNPSQGAPVTPA